MRQPRVFTSDEEILIRQMVDEGKGYNVIAKELHVNSLKIKEYLINNNINTKKEGRPKLDKPKPMNKPLIPYEKKTLKCLDGISFDSINGDHTSMPLEFNTTTANHLQYIIGLEAIPNVDFNGIIFDIGIPEAKTLVVTCPEDTFNQWKTTIDGFILSDFFRLHKTYNTISFLYKGEDVVIDEIRSHYHSLNRFNHAALKRIKKEQDDVK